MAQLKREPRDRKQQQDDFLLKLEELCNVRAACRAAKVARRSIYNWKECDEEFLIRYNKSVNMAIDMLEDEARRRAFQGVKEPVYQGGKKVGHTMRYSDTLLIFLLKAHRPETYRETVRNEHTGKEGQPIQTAATVVSNVDYRQIPTEALQAIVAARIKQED